jgi:hypothetical protein
MVHPRFRTAALAALAAVALCLPGLIPAQSAAVTIAAPSAAHPFSNPIWYPIHAKVYLDCVFTNPGCIGMHRGWTMDMVRETQPKGNEEGDIGVYAMGAGRLHIGNPHGTTCGSTDRSNFGTWVWIDHGGAVVSRYGHLARIAVADGQLVAAGQRIGTMGTSGKSSNCTVPYIDFQIRHRGIRGTLIEIRTVKACYVDNGRSVQRWPIDLNATAHWRPAWPVFPQPTTAVHYAVWNDVPQRSVDFPATSSACIPDTVPRTPTQPTDVRLARSGSGQLTVHWDKAPTSAARVQIQLGVYHATVHRWDYESTERFVTLDPSRTAYEFGGLDTGRLYRAKVSFGNAVGWSRPSVWVTKTAG